METNLSTAIGVLPMNLILSIFEATNKPTFMTPHRLRLSVQSIAFYTVITLLTGACQKESLTTASIGTDPTPVNNPPGSNLPIIHWAKTEDLPLGSPGALGREQSYGFSINGRGYVCGGFFDMPNNDLNYARDNWEFDPSTKAWTQKADFPGTWPYGGANFVIDDNAYIVAASDQQTWQYNQTNNTWTRKADYPKYRVNATGMSIGGAGYVGCGDNGSGPGPNQFARDWYMYVPYFDTWTRIADFPGRQRENAFSFVINNNGYVCSGDSNDFSTTNYFRDCWQYSATTNTWTKKAQFPGTGRANGVGLSANGRGFVTTGVTGTTLGNSKPTFLGDTWEYTPGTNSWNQLFDFGGGARYGAFGFSIGTNLYVGGGNSLLVATSAGAKKDCWIMALQ
jgi:N-acetylneuraminic acid mutarotase